MEEKVFMGEASGILVEVGCGEGLDDGTFGVGLGEARGGDAVGVVP